MTPRIVALIAAAGQSRRFGHDKRMTRLADGSTLLERSLRPYLDTVAEVYLAVRHDDDPNAFLLAESRLRCIPVSALADGLGDSLSELAAHIDSGIGGLLIGLADKPLLTADSVRQVIDALAKHEIVVPCYRGQFGHPVGFRSDWLPAIRVLRGDIGARGLLNQNKELCYLLELKDPGVVLDIDTPVQLDHVMRLD